MTLATGTMIDQFQVEERVGAGSMGDVYRAKDVSLNRRVALKILGEKHLDNRELLARFDREARSMALISHPNVVQVFSIGKFGKLPYFAMEYIEGIDLEAAVRAHGPLSTEACARAMTDAVKGLQAAAKAGLIHRDIKPSNLVRVHETGQVKVTDFGLAKPMDPASAPALTALGVVVGTPDYIAPEQARGEVISHLVDIYSLGGSLYFCLTGIPPFRTGDRKEDQYMKVVGRHLQAPPPDARVKNPSCNPMLAKLAQKMMTKKPAERPDYQLLLDSFAALGRRSTEATGPSVEIASLEAMLKQNKKKPWWLWVAVVTFVASIATLVALNM